MKEKPRQKEDTNLDVMLGTRPIFREQRPVGRLPQLNKQAKRLKRHYGQLAAS